MTTKTKPQKKTMTTFERLSSINVNKFAEKKNNLTYLSWAFAWSETKRACPDATYEIGETDYDADLGFMCHTSVTIQGETLSMWLPVMDGANKSMRKSKYTYSTRYGEKEVQGATSFDINKTLMRCLVKNLAMFGMGIYIYAGEDMPTTAPSTDIVSPTPKAEPSDTRSTLNVGDPKWSAMANFCVENKTLGYKKLTDKIGAKYDLSAAALNEIKNLIK